MTTPTNSTFYIKRHDTAPVIQCVLEDSTGAAVDLTGASVKFIMASSPGTTPVVNASATIVSATAGTVSYQWISADTAAAGQYSAEWEVTYPSTHKETFPDPSYLTVIITADLDNA